MLLTPLRNLSLMIALVCITPTTTFANHTVEAGRPAIWAATPKQIVKLNAQTGTNEIDPIDHSGIVAMAIDAGNHTVWTYGKGQLTAYTFDGSRQQQIALQPPKAMAAGKLNNGVYHLPQGWQAGNNRRQIVIGKHIDQAKHHLIDAICAKSTDLVVNEADHTVWLGLCGSVYHYSADGQLLDQFQIKGYRFLQALAVNEDRGTLWVAAGHRAIRYSSEGDEQHRITLGRFNQITDLDVNPQDGQVIIADLFGLQYFNNEGERLNQLNQRGLFAVRWDKQNGIWAATRRQLFWLDMITPGEIRSRYRLPRGFNRIQRLAVEAGSETAWISTRKGLLQIDQLGEAVQRLDNQQISAMAIYADIVAPALTVTEPTHGSFINDASPTLIWQTDATDLALDRFKVTADGQPLSITCQVTGEYGQCKLNTALPEGKVTLKASVEDLQGNLSPIATLKL